MNGQNFGKRKAFAAALETTKSYFNNSIESEGEYKNKNESESSNDKELQLQHQHEIDSGYSSLSQQSAKRQKTETGPETSGQQQSEEKPRNKTKHPGAVYSDCKMLQIRQAKIAERRQDDCLEKELKYWSATNYADRAIAIAEAHEQEPLDDEPAAAITASLNSDDGSPNSDSLFGDILQAHLSIDNHEALAYQMPVENLSPCHSAFYKLHESFPSIGELLHKDEGH